VFLFVAGRRKFCVMQFCLSRVSKAGLIGETFFNCGSSIDQWVFLMITRMGNMRPTLFLVSIREVVALVMVGRVEDGGLGDGSGVRGASILKRGLHPARSCFYRGGRGQRLWV